jgi:GT2 family glycosyltransferase
LKPRASVIVVASQDGPRLRRCLELLAELPDECEFETIAVVNGPAEPADGVHLLASPVNLGLAGALNAAREIAVGEFLVSVHDDVEPRAGWLDALVGAAIEEPDAGVIGGLVLNLDGTVQGAGWDILPNGTNHPAGATERRPVDYVQSCSMLVRSAIWDLIGGADERIYPVYHVDLDLCMAARARGARVLLEPASVLAHARGASSGRKFAAWVAERNRRFIVDKWGSLLETAAVGSGQTWSLEPGAVPPGHRASDASSREREHLARRAGLFEAYAAACVEQLGAAESERDAARAERDTAGAARDAAVAERDAAVAERDAAVAERDAAGDQLRWLTQRSETLDRVLAGGWWRLRSRLRPLLKLAGAARRRLRR